MIYFIFDLDDTVIVHPPDHEEMYDIRPDPCLINLFNRLPYKSFIFTNGTNDHAELIIEKMQIFSFKKIFARDTIPYMKPHIKSFEFVQKNILYSDYNTDEKNTFIFFDDLLENLQMAKKLGWYTIWIHPKYHTSSNYDFIDNSFPNIYDALYKIDRINFY